MLKHLFFLLSFLFFFHTAHALTVDYTLDRPTVSDNTLVVSGTINTSTHPNYKDFTLTIAVTTDDEGGEVVGGLLHTGIKPNEQGVFKDEFGIQSLNSKTVYRITYTVITPSGSDSSQIQRFSKEQQFIPPITTDDGRAQFNAQTYTLLAPLPGLSIIRDTNLCNEYKAELVKQGRSTEGVICDINDFIVFLFNMAIALSAVILVVRIILYGYNYMMTDVPFMKVNSKKGILTALGGLALALSAWILLNTINPRLVTQRVTLEEQEFEVEILEEGPSYFNEREIPIVSNITSGPIQERIKNAVSRYRESSTIAGPGGGNVACAWAVNNVLRIAGLRPIGGNSVREMERELVNGRGVRIAQSSATIGDLSIVTGAKTRSNRTGNHVGICLNSGCTKVISNSSSKKSFSWESSPDFSPSYRGASPKFYRVKN